MGKLWCLLLGSLCLVASLAIQGAFAGGEPIPANNFADLQGAWKTGCLPSTMTSMTMSFSGSSMTSQIIRYLDSACKTKFLTAIQSYKLAPAAPAKGSPPDARAVDMTLLGQSLTPETEALAKSFSVLYETKMEAGKATDVVGKGGIPPKGWVTYSIYRVKGPQLEIGDKDAYSKSVRPTKFSPVVFSKH
jgi:hypothetical protein